MRRIAEEFSRHRLRRITQWESVSFTPRRSGVRIPLCLRTINLLLIGKLMTEADGVKAQITIAIDMAERVQAAQLAYQQAVHDLQGAVILLDLTADNPYSRSSMRMAPLIGRGIIDDMEITGQVKSNLQEWFQKL
jgi:hypothetical protein